VTEVLLPDGDIPPQLSKLEENVRHWNKEQGNAFLLQGK
jgi:hypothetical protein